MIDFSKSVYFKLSPIDNEKVLPGVKEFILDDEEIIATFQTVRDQLVFTNKRIISCNVQGVSGKKIDYTSIPYSKIQTYSIETAGAVELFGRDCELEVYISAVGKIKFSIKGNFDIVKFNKIISGYVL